MSSIPLMQNRFPSQPEVTQYYDVQEEIGHGSFGIVYKAIHKVTQMPVAIKAILKESATTEGQKNCFMREVSILRMIEHPFSAQFYEMIDTEEAFYIVVEYVESESLFEHIKREGKLSEQNAQKYFTQLISILDYLHNIRHVAHRDLKAENILIDSADNIRIIDFGLSNVFTESTPLLQTACGSPAYAAPEMLKGQRYSKSADIWSAGVVLYVMVTGNLPFGGDTVQELLQKICFTQPPYPSTLSPTVNNLLHRMLMKAPTDRITLDQVKQHPFFSPIIASSYQSVTKISEQSMHFSTEIDERILEQMTALGIDHSNLSRGFLNHDYTPLTTTYNILKRKMLNNQMREIYAHTSIPKINLGFDNLTKSAKANDTHLQKPIVTTRRTSMVIDTSTLPRRAHLSISTPQEKLSSRSPSRTRNPIKYAKVNSDTKTKISQLSKDVSELQAQCNLIQHQNTALFNELQRNTEYNQQLGNELANYSDEIIELQDSIHDKQSRFAKLVAETKCLQRRLNKIRKKLMADIEFGSLIQELKSIEDKKATLMKRLNALKGETNFSAKPLSITKDILLLKSENQELKSQLELLKMCLDDSISDTEKMNVLQQEIAFRDHEYRSLLDEDQEAFSDGYNELVKDTPAQMSKSFLSDGESDSIVRPKSSFLTPVRNHSHPVEEDIISDYSSYEDSYSIELPNETADRLTREIVEEPAKSNEEKIIEDNPKIDEEVDVIPVFVLQPNDSFITGQQQEQSPLVETQEKTAIDDYQSLPSQFLPGSVKKSSSTGTPSEYMTLSPGGRRRKKVSVSRNIKQLSKLLIDHRANAETQTPPLEEEIQKVELTDREREMISEITRVNREVLKRRISIAEINKRINPRLKTNFESQLLLPPDPLPMHLDYIRYSRRQSSFGQTEITGGSLDFYRGLAEKQERESAAATSLTDAVIALKEKIKAVDSQIVVVKGKVAEEDEQIAKVRADLQKAKTHVENEKQRMDQTARMEEEMKKEIKHIDDEARKKKILLESAEMSNVQASEKLEEVLYMKDELERDVGDMEEREKPEIEKLNLEVCNHKKSLKKAQEKVRDAESDVRLKEAHLRETKESESIQRYHELKFKLKRLEMRILKWKQLAKDSGATIQSVEAFSAVNMARREALRESLEKYEKENLIRNEQLEEMERYSAMLDKLIKEENANWS